MSGVAEVVVVVSAAVWLQLAAAAAAAVTLAFGRSIFVYVCVRLH